MPLVPGLHRPSLGLARRSGWSGDTVECGEISHVASENCCCHWRVHLGIFQGGHRCLEKWTDEWSSGSHQSPMLTIQRNGNESGFEGKLWGLCHKSGMNAKAVNCAQLQHTQSKVSERIAAPLVKWWILVCHLTPLTEVM